MKDSHRLVIVPRHDLEDNWLRSNAVLRDKELVVSIDKDTIGFKLGDGNTCYSELPFVELFRAIMLGCIYMPQQSPFETIKLSLFNKDLWNSIKESGYSSFYDKLGRLLIKETYNDSN